MSLTMNPVFGRALNIWLDEASDFIAEYNEHQEMHYIAKTIVNLLRNGLDLNADDPMHPFNKYADPDMSFNRCLRAFATDVMNEIHNSFMRGYVYSFFHSGGSNYTQMHDFFALFQDFAFDTTYQNESDSESTLSDMNSSDTVVDLTNDTIQIIGSGGRL